MANKFKWWQQREPQWTTAITFWSNFVLIASLDATQKKRNQDWGVSIIPVDRHSGKLATCPALIQLFPAMRHQGILHPAIAMPAGGNQPKPARAAGHQYSCDWHKKWS